MFHVKHFEDTIVAVATPLGVGGVGVIRVSGGKALEIVRPSIKNFPQDIIPRRLYHGWFHIEDKLIDEVLFYFMKAPESYTGEDVVEISGHGGLVVLCTMLEALIQNGARLAEKGEFTKRAFLNGKIDLAQAEAIADLISAKTSLGVEVSASQLSGSLSNKISSLRKALLEVLAGVEVVIDFSEDVGELDFSALRENLVSIMDEVDGLIAGAKQGKVLREGLRVTILGKPNVGKSSLLNALVGKNRVIVSDLPGTTRDTIEEVINLNGLPLVVIDTAGIRHPKDKAEEFGVERARVEAEGADLILLIVDASSNLTEEDLMIFDLVKNKRWVLVLNKIDLGLKVKLNGFVTPPRKFEVSALYGKGIDDLRQGMFEYVCSDLAAGPFKGYDSSKNFSSLVNARHLNCLLRAKESLSRALKLIEDNAQEVLVAIDLKEAVLALGEVCGEEVSEEVINTIFEKFCVGK